MCRNDNGPEVNRNKPYRPTPGTFGHTFGPASRSGERHGSKADTLLMQGFFSAAAPGAASSRQHSTAAESLRRSFDDAVASGILLITERGVQCRCAGWGPRASEWKAHQARDEHQRWERGQGRQQALAPASFTLGPSSMDSEAAAAQTAKREQNARTLTEAKVAVDSAVAAKQLTDAEIGTSMVKLAADADAAPLLAASHAAVAVLTQMEQLHSRRGSCSTDGHVRTALTLATEGDGSAEKARGLAHAAQFSEEFAAAVSEAAEHSILSVARLAESAELAAAVDQIQLTMLGSVAALSANRCALQGALSLQEVRSQWLLLRLSATERALDAKQRELDAGSRNLQVRAVQMIGRPQ